MITETVSVSASTSKTLSSQLQGSPSPERKEAINKIAQEYIRLVGLYARGASDPQLIEIQLFSKREVDLLNSFKDNPEEKVFYDQLCQDLIKKNRINDSREVSEFQSRQTAEIINKFSIQRNVPGDGNCGLHAFAKSYVASMTRKEYAAQLCKVIRENPPLSKDGKYVLKQLEELSLQAGTKLPGFT